MSLVIHIAGRPNASHKDANGLEKPWILVYHHFVDVHRIQWNPAYSSQPTQGDDWRFLALACAMKDAALHLDAAAAQAVELHFRDSSKWT